KKYFSKFNMKGALRGDTAARSALYKDMFDRGVFSADDILDIEDEDLVGGATGNRRYVAMNMVPTDLVDQILTPAPAPAPGADPGAAPAQASKPDPMNAVRLACGRFFKDAAGRVSKRRAADRQKYAETAFLQPVLAVIECVLGKISPESEQFAATHAVKIAKFTPDWDADKPDANAAVELENTIQAVLKRGNSEKA
ncbi:MAG TPA: hypothetical protein VGP89_03510, partial [Candidatus Angelobacter sp.]|nr:hypothetical protein [Candidatus Angelobacter sp.]